VDFNRNPTGDLLKSSRMMMCLEDDVAQGILKDEPS